MRLLLKAVSIIFFIAWMVSVTNANILPHQITGLNYFSNKEEVILLQFEKKPTVILFLSSKCPCSQGHENAIRELAHMFIKKGFQFVGIHSNSDEEAETSKNHFQKGNLPFPIIRDENSKIANGFNALKTPHVFIIGKGGEILYQGGVDDSQNSETARQHYLRDSLRALETGNLPEPKETRALGCIIRRN